MSLLQLKSVQDGPKIRGLEVGDLIPFPVWIIPFPVLKVNFETLGTNIKHFVKEVF